MAHLIGKLENLQNGFLDRFLISIPAPFRPLPDEQQQAKENLSNYQFEIKDIYSALQSQLDHLNYKEFYFHDEASK